MPIEILLLMIGIIGIFFPRFAFFTLVIALIAKSTTP